MSGLVVRASTEADVVRCAEIYRHHVLHGTASFELYPPDLAEMKKADDGIPRTVAPIEEVQLYVRDAGGNRMNVSLQELIDRKMGASLPRADLHISRAGDGELFITSRQDGVIRMLVPDSAASGTTSNRR